MRTDKFAPEVQRTIDGNQSQGIDYVLEQQAILASQLCQACEFRNPTRVNDLISEGASVNTSSSDGKLPLICATETGQFTLVKLLLDKGADANRKDSNKNTALICAIKTEQFPLVNLLIENGADVNQTNNDKRTPLIHATNTGKADLVKLLVDRGADVNALDGHKCSPLRLAVYSRNEALVRLLIQNGASVLTKEHAHNTLIFHAMSVNNVRILKLLLEHSTDCEIHTPNVFGMQPLTVAIDKNNTSMVQVLLEYGAKLTIPESKHQESFMMEIVKKNMEIARLLLKANARLQFPKVLGDSTLLINAIAEDNIEMVRFLLEHGAKVNGVQKAGFTPLYYTLYGHRSVNDMVETLISRGADVNEPCSEIFLSHPVPEWAHGKIGSDTYSLWMRSHGAGEALFEHNVNGRPAWGFKARGIKPVHLAAQLSCCQDALGQILSRGAHHRAVYSFYLDLSSVAHPPAQHQFIGFENISPLHEAISQPHTRLLPRYGASLSAEDNHRRTPFEWALLGRNHAKVEELLKAGTPIENALILWIRGLQAPSKYKPYNKDEIWSLYVDILQLLVASGADPKKEYPKEYAEGFSFQA